MEIVSSIATKTFEFAVGAIFHQLGYCVHYKDNINNLKEQAKNLEFVKNSVLILIDEANDRVEDIHTHVRIRLSEVDQAAKDISKFLKNIEEEKEKNCFNGSCLNLVQRYRLSREATKMRNELAKIQAELEKLDKISYCGPLPWIDSVQGYQNFESRMLIMENIRKALEDPNVYMIGVHGMGGIGKTMLVKEISCQASKSKLFIPIIMAVVGQNPDVKHIQGQLADMLRFKFEEETEEGRALVLRNRLQKEEKILIIIDDVWNGLDLEGVGIPSSNNHKGCKIIVTSRFKDILSTEMRIEKTFMVEDLTKEESWIFFKSMIDESIETNNKLKKVTKEVAEKCGKLPIALVVVATTLKGKPLHTWKDALRQLKNPASVEIDGVSKEVYASLKLTYDHIKSREAQLLFLLCSMFPDDYTIDIDDLSIYATGLKFVQGVDTLGTTRDKILTMVDYLESSCFLQKFENEWNGHMCVKMHDVIRDVAIHIASKDDQMCTLSYGKGLNKWQDEKTHGHYTAVFANCLHFEDLPLELNFPNLELLALLDYQYSKENLLQIPESFLKRMGNLKVIHLEGMRFSPSPSSFNYLANIRTLLLIDCHLENIDMIGNLKNLEILDLSRSDIMELPSSMSQLSQLKQLKLGGCSQLKVIQPNVISRMTKLEELYIDYSFDGWEMEDFNDCEKKNVSISELGCLSYLTRIYICILDGKCLPGIAYLNNFELESFQIVIGTRGEVDYRSTKNMLDIKIEDLRNGVVLKELWVNRLLKKCEVVRLEGICVEKNVFLELSRNVSPYLIQLILEDNENVEYLTTELDDHELSCIGFLILESLYLSNMRRLESIIQGSSFKTVKVFERLKKLLVFNCGNMKYLFPISIAEGLSNLEDIRIVNCKMMEAIMVIENEAPDKILFRKLRQIDLTSLPELKSFCGRLLKGKELIQTSDIVEEEDQRLLPNSITPLDCQLILPNSERVFISIVKNVGHNLLIANSSNKLQHIRLYGCENVESVFSGERGKNIEGLQTLQIQNSKLESLTLWNLPNLKQVWNKDIPYEILTSFQSLTHVNFNQCPKFKTVFPYSLAKHLQQLQKISIRLCGIDEIFGKEEELELEYSKSKVSFPSLKSLKIESVNNLVKIWHNQLVVDDMFNLQFVELDNCKSLKCIFTSNVMRALKRLDKLHIQNCDSIEEVFEIHRRIEPEEDDHEVASISLKKLLLCNLPSLKHIWSNDPYEIYQFQDLNDVEVSGCPKLKTIFPPSLTRDLQPKLQRLHVG